MKRIRLARISLITGGILNLSAAMFHFTWLFQMINYEEYAKLSKPYSDLVLLCAIF